MELLDMPPTELAALAAPPLLVFIICAIAGALLYRRAKRSDNDGSAATASLVLGVASAVEGTFFGVIGLPFALATGIAAVAACRAHKTLTGTAGNNASTAGLMLGIVGIAMCIIGLGQTGVIMFSTGA
ncbi:MAG: hypothetical protein Q4B35_01250 [Slackia sp.]|nr:hypothetical protein [Slackia sp.]